MMFRVLGFWGRGVPVHFAKNANVETWDVPSQGRLGFGGY